MWMIEYKGMLIYGSKRRAHCHVQIEEGGTKYKCVNLLAAKRLITKFVKAQEQEGKA